MSEAAEQKPIIEKVKDFIPDSNTVKDAVQSVGTTVSNGIDNVKSGVQNTLGDFSQKGVVNASNDFLESNGLFAKFAFIILVLIVFLFLFKMGLSIIGYFSQPSSSPYLVKGLLDGASPVTVSQNPGTSGSKPILRSVNGQNGVEFTWSVWLYLQYKAASGKGVDGADAIFVKAPDSAAHATMDGAYNINGPGLYVQKVSDGSVTLGFFMDDIVNNTMDALINNKKYIKLDNLPLNKWVHVAFRLQNTVLDSYVNGVIAQRLQMQNAPKQNYYDVKVFPKGFQGQLSNLQYFDRALNVFEINNIVMFGPNLSTSKFSNSAQNATGNYSYLNTAWYSGWYNRA